MQDLITKKIGDGEYIPGYKLIPTEGNRAWSLDDAETIKALRTAGLQKKDYEKSVIVSPTQAQKLLKSIKPKDHEKRYEKLAEVAVHRPAGNDKIVKDDSPIMERETITKNQ